MLLVHAAGTTALTVAGLEVPHARLSPNSRALDGVSWPEAFLYSKKDLTPDWDGKDGMFYALPKLGHHAGEECRSSLTKFYECALPPSGTGDVLDLCSSFTSHYPDKYKAKRCVALGLNALELAVNPSKTEWRVQDLNENPTLPYDSESFDVITNSLSVDYLTSPLEVFGEMHRVLRPGGKALMSFSNRCFPSKAVKMWLYADDATRMEIVASYYNFAPQGGWDNIEAYDIKKGGDGAAPDALADPLGFLGALFGSVGGDPMFVVTGTKR